MYENNVLTLALYNILAHFVYILKEFFTTNIRKSILKSILRLCFFKNITSKFKEKLAITVGILDDFSQI